MVLNHISTQKNFICYSLTILLLNFTGLKDRQHRIAADLQHSLLSLTYFLTSRIEMCTIYDKIDNLERFLGI